MLRNLARRLRALIRRDSIDHEMRQEMDAHLERAAERLIARGMSPDAARLEARREFGNVGVLQEEGRDARGVRWVGSLLGDARFALRHFTRRPLHSLTIIGVLSLGIGGHAAVFTMLQSMTVRPAPGVPDDASLVQIRGKKRLLEATKWQPRLLSYPEWRELAAASKAFSSVAAVRTSSAAIRAEGAEVDQARVHFVSDNYFSTLGIPLILGAGLPRTTDAISGEPVAIISNVTWRNSFAGSPDVLNRSITVNGVATRIVGVAPERFHGAFPINRPNVAWMQLPMAASVLRTSLQSVTSNDSTSLETFARLQPGVGRAEASAVVQVIGSRAIAERRPPSRKMIYDTDVASMGTGDMLPHNDDLALVGVLWTTSALLVLLVTCTNVSALVVGAGVARRHEIAVRLSLGASRARIVRHLVTENTMLALAAGGLGLTLYWWFAAVASKMDVSIEMRPNVSSIAFTLFVALGTGILFGLSPALHATRSGVSDALKDSGGGQASRSRLQRVFIVAQIALTQPLLVGLAVLLGLISPGTGVTKNGVEKEVISLPVDKLITLRVDLVDRDGSERFRQNLRALPGVVGAIPDARYGDKQTLIAHSADRIPSTRSMESFVAKIEQTIPGYFALLDIPIVRGRDLLASDAPNDAAVIGSDLARSMWGAQDPIGKRFQSPDSAGRDRGLTVVGVYDARYETTDTGGDRVYVVRESVPRVWLIRTAGPAASLIDSVRSVFRATFRTGMINGLQTIATERAALKGEAMNLSVSTAGAGLLALLLASLGLYGVINLAVGQRRREIGIRMALGARASEVVGLLFKGGIRLSIVGLMIGLPLSLVALRVLSGTLGIPVVSMPLIGAGIALAVLAVAAIATWIPARRAATVNPVTALRAE